MTTSKKITKTAVIQALSTVVEKYGPDTVYLNRAIELGIAPKGSSRTETLCSYTNGKRKAACLVGVVLYEGYDVPLAKLRAIDTDADVLGAPSAAIEDVLGAIPDYLGVEFNDAARAALVAAQEAQDLGKTWGQALAAAKRASSR